MGPVWNIKAFLMGAAQIIQRNTSKTSERREVQRHENEQWTGVDDSQRWSSGTQSTLVETIRYHQKLFIPLCAGDRSKGLFLKIVSRCKMSSYNKMNWSVYSQH